MATDLHGVGETIRKNGDALIIDQDGAQGQRHGNVSAGLREGGKVGV